MKNKIDKSMVISSILCLLPILFGLIVYEDIPDQIAIHWNAEGIADNYASKTFAVFAMPCFFLLINLIVHFMLNNDPKKKNSPVFLMALGKWICPVLSVVLMPITLFIAMGVPIPVDIIVMILLGLIILISGNYLPKCKQNYTVGIKLPWTLNNETNWNRTHHIAGYVWMIGGIILLVNAFFSLWYVEIAVILLLILIPTIYSFLLYKKGF